MGRLKSVSVYHEAESCMAKLGRECPKNCCDNTTEQYKVDDITNNVQKNHSFDTTLALITGSYFGLLLENIEVNTDQGPKYLNYKPPLIDQNITVQIQSFLI